MYYIYSLVDPINKRPFYIGKGKGNRVYDHIKGWDKTNKRKVDYIKTLRELGIEPQIHYIIENIENEKVAYEYENSLIDIAVNVYNIPLTNRVGVDLRPPSRLGTKHTKDSILKISEANRRRKGLYKMSAEQKMLLSEIHKGKKKPERTLEYRKNIGISKSKDWVITFPDGHTEKIQGLRSFCISNNLNQAHMHSTSTGKRTHHKGFKATKV